MPIQTPPPIASSSRAASVLVSGSPLLDPALSGGLVVSQYARRNPRRLSSLQAANPVLSLYPSTAARLAD